MRNVVLVTIDSLRADHCGFVGYDKETTPNLDRMADEGLSFNKAIAPGPSTYESMPAIITGRHMCQYPDGGGDDLDERTRHIRLNTRRQTVAEWFACQGYATGAFTTNPYTARNTNFARGFDRYEDFLDGGEGPLMRRAAHLPVLSELKHLVTLVRGDRASKPWRDYADETVSWARTAAEPYFLWLFALEPHTPYLPPEEHRQSGRAGTYYHNWKLWADKKWGVDLPLDHAALRDLYDSAVRTADDLLAHLRDSLPGDPILVVHSDHGEGFGEHGAYGHDSQLYEENLHVPLVVAGEGVPDRTVERPVSLTVLPALLRAAARGDLDDPPAPSPGYALARTLGLGQIALRGRDWKYLAHVADGGVDREELYDLESDPGETESVAGIHGDLVDAGRSVVCRRLEHEREVARTYRAAGAL